MSKRTKKFAKRKPRRTKRVFLLLLFFFIALPALAGGWFLATFDINDWREAIAKAVSKQIGREIKLDGPITWAISLNRGLSVSLSDVTVANPRWASRRDMARIGQAALNLDVRALLNKKLDIIAFDLTKADVQLETNAEGVGNWVFKKEADAIEIKPIKDPRGPTHADVAINLREVRIVQSRFGLTDKSGKLTILDVPELILTEDSENLEAKFKGSIGAVPVQLFLLGGPLEGLSSASWPFAFQASYAHAKIEAKGSLQDKLKKAIFDSFSVGAKESKLAAEQFIVDLSGERPSIKGKLNAKKLDPDDFRFAPASQEKPPAQNASTNKDKEGKDRLFSHTPLDLKNLKALDAKLEITITDFAFGLFPLQDVKTSLSLENGVLVLSPLSAAVAGSRLGGQIALDASAPESKLDIFLKGDNLDFAKLFDFASIGDLISGKVNMDLDLKTSGQSSHDLASHANGRFNLLMDTGTLSSSGVKNLAGTLVDIFLPGVRSLASPGINCMAARYTVTNGLVETKGLLIDMDNTTVAGSGTVNLPDEHINMRLRTRPKGVGLGAIVPPMKIDGSLTSPEFTLDAGRALQKVKGLLMNEGLSENGVPNMLHIKGKNDCAVTLDNPALAAHQTASQETPLEPGGAPLTDAVKDIGGKILENIGKGLFGN